MIEIERDGEYATQVFACVTMLNRLVSEAGTTGLRIDIELEEIRHTGCPWETPLVSAHVYRPVKPKTDPTSEAAPESEEAAQ
jgi:hypothetical protein